MFWVPEGTLSSKMIQNISIVDFHTLPYHQMTLLGLWRANLGPKLTQKRSNLTWFCNNLQFFTYLLYQPYKHIEISLFTPNQTSMVISECIMAISMSKMDPKKAKFDIFLYNSSICHLITFTWFCLPRMKPISYLLISIFIAYFQHLLMFIEYDKHLLNMDLKFSCKYFTPPA